MGRKKGGEPAPKPDNVVVKVGAEVIADARAIAGIRGVSLTEYLTEALRPVIRKDLEQALTGKMKSLKGKGERPE